MQVKKSKKDPTKVSVKEFFGNSLAAIAAGEATDHRADRAAIERALDNVRVPEHTINKSAYPDSQEDLECAIKAALSAIQLPATESRDVVKDWWPVRLLRDTPNDPEAYKRRLSIYFCV
jgi:hypothetical protein